MIDMLSKQTKLAPIHNKKNRHISEIPSSTSGYASFGTPQIIVSVNRRGVAWISVRTKVSLDYVHWPPGKAHILQFKVKN